jgi:dUTP pyrophosphatase
MTQVNVKILENGAGLELPKYATAQSAGADLLAAIEENLVLKAGEWALVPTGIAIALPADFEAQVRPRSGLAAKNGVTVLNTPGTIDADYRGEVKVILMNHSKQDFIVERGMRIAQVIFAPVVQAQWNVVEDLEATARGEGGFGSTGTKTNAA